MAEKKKPAKKPKAAAPKKKGAGGRPTKYTPEMCATVIQAGREGCAVAEMAIRCDVCIDTIYEWAKVHPEFSEALTRAQSEAEAWWAAHVRSGLTKPPSEFQGQPNLKYMAVRFNERWADKSRLELSGKGGGPVQTVDLAALQNLTDNELEQLERIAEKLGDPASRGNTG